MKDPLVTVLQFRAFFPIFTQDLFPDETVQMWIDQALSFMSARVWEKDLSLGVCKWVAHELCVTIGRPNEKGKLTMITNGPLSSTTAGQVSFSYDTSSSSIDGIGSYNLTPYGQQWYTMAKAKARFSSISIIPEVRQW